MDSTEPWLGKAVVGCSPFCSSEKSFLLFCKNSEPGCTQEITVPLCTQFPITEENGNTFSKIQAMNKRVNHGKKGEVALTSYPTSENDSWNLTARSNTGIFLCMQCKRS